MSCFFRGPHRSPGLPKTQKVLCRSQAVCNPMCTMNPKTGLNGCQSG